MIGSGNSWYPGLVLDFKRKGFNFSPYNMTLSVSFLFTDWDKILLYLFSPVFYHEKKLDFVIGFFCIYRSKSKKITRLASVCVNVLHLMVWVCWITLVFWDEAYFAMMYYLFADTSHSVWQYFVEDFASIFIKETVVCNSFIVVGYLSDFGIRVMLSLRNYLSFSFIKGLEEY